jgi:hypothetical protein
MKFEQQNMMKNVTIPCGNRVKFVIGFLNKNAYFCNMAGFALLLLLLKF